MSYIDTEVFNFDKRIYFIAFVSIVIILTWYSNELLVSDNLYYSYFGDQLSFERIEIIIIEKAKWEWIIYALLPVLYLIKFTLIAICLTIGAFIFNHKISFKKLFQIVLIAESIFLIPIALKILWFLLIQTDYTLTDLQYFYPLSLLNLLNPEHIAKWFIYPLQLLNVFELMYGFILAYGLYLVLKKSYNNMLKWVLSTYGVGLFLWAVFVVFLNVSLS